MPVKYIKGIRNRRYRMPTAKPNELKVAFGSSRDQGRDIYYCNGGDGASKRDAMLLMHFFDSIRCHLNGKTLLEDLQDRGYDLTTLKFTIHKLENDAPEGLGINGLPNTATTLTDDATI